jgi:hypothetical protein
VAGLDTDFVSRAIAATREGLAASNYTIDCADDGDGRLVFAVRALGRCVRRVPAPKPIFVDVLKRELGDSGIEPAHLDVVYPLEDEA